MAAPSMRDFAARDYASPRSFGDLLNDLTDGSTQLVRDEIRLARIETVESVLALRQGATWLGVGVGFVACAAGAAVACIIMLLSLYILGGRTWLAALIVAVVLCVVGVVCVIRARSAFKSASLAPRETATSLKETAAWLKHPTKSAVR
ncbi:MAG: phage holin family protein [Gemmatimonadaceae bacterium]